MGESSIDRAPFDWNRSIEVDASDESVSADAGALLMRETLEHSGIVSWLEENLIDDRRPGSVLHSTGNLLRTCLLLLCQGHRDQDDADRLRHDPAIAAAAKSSGGPVRFDGGDGLPSQPTHSRFVDQLSSEENLDVLKQGILSNGLRRIREGSGGSEDFLVIDVDDVPFLADGHQPGSRYCGYVGHRCYSALVAVSGESGDILGARLRRPEEDKAGETFDFVLPVVAGALEEGGGRPVLVRMDAGFPDGRTLAEFDALSIQYLARVRNNAVLNRMAEPHLDKPADMAPGEVRTVFHEHEYQARGWDRKRRVTLVVIFSERELFPRPFWLITSLTRELVGGEELLARYRARGKAENTFGELKGTLRSQLPSSPRPPTSRHSAGKNSWPGAGKHAASQSNAGKTIERSEPPVRQEWRPQNEAFLRLALLALLGYQTTHEGRCAMEDASGKGWSLETFREKVLRAGCRVARHARRMKFHIAKSVANYWSILHPAGATEEVHHAKRVAHTPASRPSPTHVESGCPEPWHPAAQTSG